MVTIVQKEDPVLRGVAEPVNPKDFASPRLKKILADMATALEKEEDGVAIAAPQIGVPLRIFVVSHRAFEYIEEDPVLREIAEPVNPKDFSSPRLKTILGDMATALEKEEDGVAIAAPQIGVPLRIFVVSHRAFEYIEEEEHHLDEEDDTHPLPAEKAKRANMVFINPVITKLSRKKKWLHEGCLSVRWLYGEVSRADKATVRAYDENGKVFTWGGSGLLAQIFQHETDHLNGALFIDTARNVEKITAEEMETKRNDASADLSLGRKLK